MTRSPIISTVISGTTSLFLIVPAWAQSPLAGAVTRAAEDYKNCMLAPVADYAQRVGTPENLAKQVAGLCADEKSALSAAYIRGFIPDRTKGEAKNLAKTYVDQIVAANLEIVRLDIARLRIESEHAR